MSILSTDEENNNLKLMKTNSFDSLIQGFDKRSLITFGENNSAEYNDEGLGDPRLALFFKLVHHPNIDILVEYIEKIINLFIMTKNISILIDLFVIIYQTRDIRGGKGRRDLFYYMLLITYDAFPTIICDLLFLIPDYGYYKDFFNILKIIYSHNSEIESNKYKMLIDKIYELVINQLKLDAGEYENAINESRKPIISLLAKYIPKEGKHFDKQYSFVTTISNMMYPGVKELADRKKCYRIEVSLLNKALNITEIKMSAKKFSEIVFSKITAKNALKYRKAFLNINVNDELQRSIEYDRIEASNNFINSIIQNKLKGGSLEIYDVVKAIINYLQMRKTILYRNPANTEIKLFETLWENMRNSLVKKINKNTNNTFNLDNIIPIVDVSGSMVGMPLLVGIGLGILISDLGIIAKDKIMTFSQNPTWVNLENLDIVSKIDKILQSEWGLSTNFEKVYKLIIDIIRTKKLKQYEIPNIIVFSDMQFDEAVESTDIWDTHYEKIVKEFEQVGIEIEGNPYQPPMIVFWNLRGDTEGFPVMKNTKNVKMLSGFSPNLFEYVINGNINDNMHDNMHYNNKNDMLSKLNNNFVATPYSTLRKILDDGRYEIVREIVKACIENDQL